MKPVHEITVVGAKLTEANKNGEQFIQLKLEQLVAETSKVTGKPYLAVKRVSIIAPPQYDMVQCQALVGSKFPGNIVRKECTPYRWVNPDGVEVELAHTYELEF